MWWALRPDRGLPCLCACGAVFARRQDGAALCLLAHPTICAVSSRLLQPGVQHAPITLPPPARGAVPVVPPGPPPPVPVLTAQCANRSAAVFAAAGAMPEAGASFTVTMHRSVLTTSCEAIAPGVERSPAE